MLDRTLAKDAAFDRKFIVGVTSTRIYCVASCKAPKPKPENIQFFATPEQAAQAGLRACKRCFPNEAFAGIDPDELLFERLVEEVRSKPQRFEGVESMARWVGVSVSRLHSGLRKHFHATPLELLTEARVARACQLLLSTDLPVTAVGADAGFASTSVYYEQFGRLTGLSPAAYRALNDAQTFDLSLPCPYPHELMMGYLGRDDSDPILKRCGNAFRFILPGNSPSIVEFAVQAGRVRVSTAPGDGPRAHGLLRRMLGLNQDPRPLDATLATDSRFGILAADAGLRVFQTPEIFDAIAWSIVGQQLTVRFAMVLRRRLFEVLDIPQVDGLYPPLQPDQVAELDPERLLPLQFSQRKAEYVVGVAKRFVKEGVKPEDLHKWSATRVQRWLGETRGFGPWSTNYVMMRGCGFGNCVPFGDTGLTSGLAKLYDLPERPNPEQTVTLMKPFEPYRSLATFRIWYSRRLWAKEEVVLA